MRDPLQDITHTVVTVESAGQRQHQQQHQHQRPVQPKLLRQTSLFAFTTARTTSPSSLSDRSSSSSSSPAPPPSDEGYAASSSPTRPECSGGSSSSNKRRKVSFGQSSSPVDDEQEVEDSSSEEEEPVDPVVLARRARVLQARQAASAGPSRFADTARRTEYAQHVRHTRESLRSISGPYPSSHLNSFVSHNANDVFRCMSQSQTRDFAPPFACAFSNASRAGGKKVLAVADEEGIISLVDAEKKPDYDYAAPLLGSFQPHQNAVFDVKWSADDTRIATASGDQTIILSDVESKARLVTLAVHTCSVKQIAWDPHNPNLLSSASRDGSIAVWDQRLNAKDGRLAPVNHIRFAHDTWAKTRKNKDTTRSATRSVTSIVYMQHQEHLLASAGSADGAVKLWDLRKNASRRINPESVECSVDFTAPLGGTSARPYGIASLCLSPDGGRLFALGTNSKIYQHDPLCLSRPLDAPMHTFSSPASLLSSSFYVRLSMSPDGRYLACGSSGLGFGTSIFDTTTTASRRVFGETREASAVLHGHRQEVGSLDWADGALATCGDDLSVRVWRPNAHVAQRALAADDADERWHYSGAWSPLPKKAVSAETSAMECD